MRRARERDEAKELRREALRRRRAGIAAGAAIGATALFAGPAQAAEFVVNSTGDGPPDACDAECTLRDAVETADAAPGEDVITFASELTGEIRLTEGDIEINDAVTIDGPGLNVLAVSGDNDDNGLDAGDFRIFSVYASGVTIEGLTLTEGGGAFIGSQGGTYNGEGGALFVSTGETTVRNAAITNSRSNYAGGGAFLRDGALSLENTTVSGNEASSGGGLSTANNGYSRNNNETITITGSTISGNQAGSEGSGIDTDDNLIVRNSTISGNTGASNGGGISHSGKYSDLEITNSTISGNEAEDGAGIHIGDFGKYATRRTITTTTISGNTADEQGGGVYVAELGDGSDLTISRSTLSGNRAAQGGGIHLEDVGGQFVLSNSTLSGNTADIGGGVTVGGPDDNAFYGDGTADFANSTIASNTATRGGGIYLSSYSVYSEGSEEPTITSGTASLTSTIVADNAGGDLDRADDSTGGGFDLAFSLVETPGDAPLFQSAGDHNIVGADPQLGALGNNGGPTATHVPAQTSPVIDKGDAPPRLDTDQRGGPRTLDGAPPNPEGGDGTDIGAVEIDRVPGTTPTTPTNTVTQEVIFQRVRPRGITVKVTPKRDTRAPFTFTTTGRILPPSGLSSADACRSVGLVSVQVQRRKATISNRRATLRPDCTFASQVTFKYRKRFGSVRRLKFTIRFAGNQRLEPFTANPRFRRVR